jgi:hypothetical protein
MSRTEAVAFCEIRAKYYRRQAAQVQNPERARLANLLAQTFEEKIELLRREAA